MARRRRGRGRGDHRGRRSRPWLPAFAGATVVIADEDREPVAVDRARPHPDHPAYVIYTSGSTGPAQGRGRVPPRHRQPAGVDAGRLRPRPRRPGAAEDARRLRRVGVGAVLAADPGAAVVMADARRAPRPRPPGRARSGAKRVTTLHFVPSMLEAFLGDRRGHRRPRMGRAACAASCAAARRWRRPPPSAGPACTGVPAAQPLRAHRGGRRRHLVARPTAMTTRPPCPSAGPVWNTGALVLDRHLRPVPVGVPGELYLTGVQLARGYLGRPGSHRRAVRRRPVRRTGRADVPHRRPRAPARRRRLDYLGRTDDQVKIRGHRIELGEIEAALTALDGVDRAVVVARRRPGRAARLVAYVVGRAGPTIGRGARAAWRPRCPPPWCRRPSSCSTRCRSRPTARSTGPRCPPPTAAGARPVPRRPARRRRCRAVPRCSARSSASTAVGPDDDFFALGGDSICHRARRPGPARTASRSRPGTCSTTPRRPSWPGSPRR